MVKSSLQGDFTRIRRRERLIATDSRREKRESPRSSNLFRHKHMEPCTPGLAPVARCAVLHRPAPFRWTLHVTAPTNGAANLQTEANNIVSSERWPHRGQPQGSQGRPTSRDCCLAAEPRGFPRGLLGLPRRAEGRWPAALARSGMPAAHSSRFKMRLNRKTFLDCALEHLLQHRIRMLICKP